MQGAAR